MLLFQLSSNRSRSRILFILASSSSSHYQKYNLILLATGNDKLCINSCHRNDKLDHSILSFPKNLLLQVKIWQLDQSLLRVTLRIYLGFCLVPNYFFITKIRETIRT